jgi:hypothetical protein
MACAVNVQHDWPPRITSESMTKPGAHVVPASGGGWIDETLSSFTEALADAFLENRHVAPHFEKLERANADERHLFIPLHDSALPFSVGSELIFSDTLPPDPPRVPRLITHLWVAPAFGKRVLLWSRSEGWRNCYPYGEK